MTSGFLLFRKIKCGNTEGDDILKSYLIHFIKMYCAWSLVYFPFAAYFYITSEMNLLIAIADYFRGFFLIGQHYFSYQLWYLLSAILSVFLLRIIYGKISDRMLLLAAAVVYMFSEVLTYLADHTDLYTGNLYMVGRAIQLTIGDGLVLSGFFWFVLGGLLYTHKNMIRTLSEKVWGGVLHYQQYPMLYAFYNYQQ